MNVKTWNIEAMTGYKPKTTFYEDFSIADWYGVEAIKDTYKRAFEAWKDDVVFITEFIMALNWKIWEHYESNKAYAEIYNDLWQEADQWACENLTGEDLAYYYRTTD